MKSVEVENIRACLEVAKMAMMELETHFRASAPVGSKIHWFEEVGGKTIVREGTVESYGADSVWVRMEPIRTARMFHIRSISSKLASQDDFDRSKAS